MHFHGKLTKTAWFWLIFCADDLKQCVCNTLMLKCINQYRATLKIDCSNKAIKTVQFC